MIKAISRLSLFLVILCFSQFIYAHDSQEVVNPQVLLQKTISSLQYDIEHHTKQLKSSPQELYALVTKHLMPIIDLERMAELTLGPKWRQASQAQKKAFIDAFSQLLTRTYATALLSLSEYKFVLRPLRGNGWKHAKNIQVQGKIERGGKSSGVTYYLTLNQQHHWQIYDFAVEGVSFMKNFKAQFEAFADIAKLNTKLNAMNKAAEK